MLEIVLFNYLAMLKNWSLDLGYRTALSAYLLGSWKNWSLDTESLVVGKKPNYLLAWKLKQPISLVCLIVFTLSWGVLKCELLGLKEREREKRSGERKIWGRV